MMRTKGIVLSLVVMFFSISLAMAASQDKQDIIDTAIGAGSFKTLASALAAADLVTTLKGDGPFTVFAPFNSAFAALDNETVSALIEGLQDGTIDAIASDHAPHEADSKNVEFEIVFKCFLGKSSSLYSIMFGAILSSKWRRLRYSYFKAYSTSILLRSNSSIK